MCADFHKILENGRLLYTTEPRSANLNLNPDLLLLLFYACQHRHSLLLVVGCHISTFQTFNFSEFNCLSRAALFSITQAFYDLSVHIGSKSCSVPVFLQSYLPVLLNAGINISFMKITHHLQQRMIGNECICHPRLDQYDRFKYNFI